MVGSNRNSKQVMLLALAHAKIDVPSTATIAQIREISTNSVLNTDDEFEQCRDEEETATDDKNANRKVMPVDFDGIRFYEATDDNSNDAISAVNMTPAINAIVRNAERSSEPVVHLLPLTYDARDWLIDDKLAQVRKKKEILELKQQIRQLERALAHPVDTNSNQRLNFGDVEHAIIKFAGDDCTHDVNLFFYRFGTTDGRPSSRRIVQAA